MELVDAIDATEVAVTALGDTGVDHCDASLIREQLRRLKRVESRLGAQVGRLTHAADRAGAFIGTGARDTAEWLGGQTGTSTRRNRAAAELGEAMAGSDALAGAVGSGRVSTDQASAAIGAAAGERIDDALIAEIADLPLPAIRATVEEWRNRRSPDSDEDRAEAQRSRRFLHVRDQPDGMTRVDGLLDPESGAIVRAALDGVMDQSHGDGTNRTRDQRCADALTQLCAAAGRGALRGGRSNSKLLATVPFDTITERAPHRGRTHVGPTLDAGTIRRLACDAGIHRVITGPASSVLDFGRETRLVPENLYLALVARDQCCRWPGCQIRATWCDAHHIVHWADDGYTDQDNCVLLCHRHHQLSHQPGWSVTGTGTELVVRHPDGTIDVSRPPGPPGGRTVPPGGPPAVAPPRAGTTGRQPPADLGPPPAGPMSTGERPSTSTDHEQLVLAGHA